MKYYADYCKCFGGPPPLPPNVAWSTHAAFVERVRLRHPRDTRIPVLFHTKESSKKSKVYRSLPKTPKHPAARTTANGEVEVETGSRSDQRHHPEVALSAGFRRTVSGKVSNIGIENERIE
jgi:hypothetical protein